MLAMMVAGYMAKRHASDGQATSAGGGLGGLLGGLARMVDQDGNGNPLDDILRQVGRLSR